MAKKPIISMKSIFYTAISLVWIFGLSAIGHITMVLIEKYNPAYKFTFAWQMFFIGFVAIYATRWLKSDGWQSFWGTLGGLGMWFSFEYSLMYGAERMGVCYTWNGSYPEYRLMKWTIVMLAMVFVNLMYQERTKPFITYIGDKNV